MDQDAGSASPDPSIADPAVRPRTRRRRGRPSRARGRPNSSDDASGRWTIRGVPPPVREMALRHANQRGMTVGDWVAEALVAFARSAEKPGAEGSNLPTTEAPRDIVQVLERLDARLTRLEQDRGRGFFGRLFGRRKAVPERAGA